MSSKRKIVENQGKEIKLIWVHLKTGDGGGLWGDGRENKK